MHSACLRDGLKRALALVRRAVPAKPANPILAGMRLAADGNHLTLAATDLDLGVTAWVEAEVNRAGTIVVPGRLFADVINDLPNDRVTLTLDASTLALRVSCGPFVTIIKGADADDFPAMPATLADGETMAILPATALRQAIEQVAFAASADESRPMLTGVLMRLDAQTLALAAVDGFRLATRQVSLAVPVCPNVEVIVPARAMAEVARIVRDAGSGDVDLIISPSGSHALFRTPVANLACGLIDGRFPDVERVIPRTVTGSATVSVSDLAAAVRLARCFTTPLRPGVNLSVEDAMLRIASHAPEHGDYASTIPCVRSEGAWSIALHAEYLLDALRALTAPRVTLQWTGAEQPFVLVAESDDPSNGVNGLQLIMPLTKR